ncbi:hypothetical protein [Aquabacterium sp.]|uniref:hypothetical protein n=1 Tax=Aquabacterium sp. TaxID=1872578 RepID=UPI0025B9B0F3|nr:hypothetical protein [Aquabacterium sp.]
MKIISHRGYWKSEEEKNTNIAFDRSFNLAFGTETDIRDFDGELVISHDPARRGAIKLKDFLESYKNLTNELPLALNIKSDGLAFKLAEHMKERQLDWFSFDMSIPDTRHHLAAGNPVFIRVSEFERHPPWLEKSAGIWLDAFESIWYDRALIESYLRKNLKVCVVSAELHGRDHADLWDLLRPLAQNPNLLLCTDLPELARSYFSSAPKNSSKP